MDRGLYIVRLGKARGQGAYVDVGGGSCESQSFAAVFPTRAKAEECVRAVEERGVIYTGIGPFTFSFTPERSARVVRLVPRDATIRLGLRPASPRARRKRGGSPHERKT